MKFMNEKAGTDRLENGKLASSAGRVDSLDELAAKFFEDEGGRDAVVDELEKACEAFDGDECKWYKKIMTKVSKKGTEYVSNEKNRLEKMMGNENVVGKKKDVFQIRINTLNAFLGE
eukprot:UN04046